MNPFYNPIFLAKILKSYLIDIDRLKNLNPERLQRYQDNRVHKMVKYAFTVPMYHDVFKKAGVQSRDIRGVQDLEKLPMISKDVIKRYYPDGLISTRTRKEQLIEVSTSGTTGKKLTIYVDMFDIIWGFFGYLRSLREHGINWRRTKLTIIGDFAPHTAESGYVKKWLLPQSTVHLDNIQWLDTNDEPKKLIEEIDRFKPEFIGGYVGMLGHLALLKEKGFGTNVAPRYIGSTGAVMDPSLRGVIEKAFNATVFEVYGATESGPLAFQCRRGKYHIMSDLVYLEFLKDLKPVASGEPRRLVVTKLYGGGTPIVRYDAINDIVAPNYEGCTCGLSGGVIERIYGRDDLSLIFSGGRVLLPASIAEIYSRVLYQLKSTRLKETKVVQSNLNKLEIYLVLEKKQPDDAISDDAIISVIEEGFQEKVGSDVEIMSKQVKRIDSKGPRIVSMVDRTRFETIHYI